MGYPDILSLYNSIPLGVCVIDRRLEVVYVNDAFEKYASRKTVVRRAVTTLFPIFAKAYFQMRLDAVFNQRMPMYLSSGIHGPIFAKRFQKQEAYFELSVSPVMLAGESERYAVLTIEEVTDLMRQIEHQKQLLDEVKLRLEETIQAKEALGESKYRLKEANQAKDKLFSIIGHDLRTPFNTLTGISEVLLKTADNNLKKESKSELFEAMWLAAKQGLDLVNNLLNWARSQTGRIKCYPVQFDMVRVAEEVHSYLSLSAKKKEISLRLMVPSKACLVFSDIDMIKVVIQNLVSNAVKFTPNGGSVEMRVENWGRAGVKIVVEDTGIGMGVGMVNKLLNGKDVRSGKGTELETGTGLGIAICRDFLRLNNSELILCSQPGKGTVAGFYLAN